jgi:hypothetical protein
MAPEQILIPPACPVPHCPVGAIVAVHGAELASVKSDIGEIKRGIGRIEWWAVKALISFVGLCLAAIFRLLMALWTTKP